MCIKLWITGGLNKNRRTLALPFYDCKLEPGATPDHILKIRHNQMEGHVMIKLTTVVG